MKPAQHSHASYLEAPFLPIWTSPLKRVGLDPCCPSRSPPSAVSPARPGPYLKVMMLGCFSFRRCLMSVSFRSRTFFTATSSPWKRPRKTAPWAPEPTHCKSRISSKGTSHRSVESRYRAAGLEEPRSGPCDGRARGKPWVG